MIREVIFDLDDLLILTTPHYDTTSIEAFYVMSSYFGNKSPSFEWILKKHREIEKKLHIDGYIGIERYSKSLLETYKLICTILNFKVDEEISNRIFDIGKKPFNIKCYEGQDLMPGAEELLNFLVQEKCRLKLYTKGEQWYQKQKIAYFKLDRWFSKNKIVIKSKKQPKDLVEMVSDLDQAYFLTDSTGDVKVGIEAGIRVGHVLLPEIYRSSWDNEDESPESDLCKKYENLLQFKANYYFI